MATLKREKKMFFITNYCLKQDKSIGECKNLDVFTPKKPRFPSDFNVM